MDFGAFDFRARRNFLNRGMSFTHMHYNVANYNTDSPIDKKTDMKAFDEDIFTKIQSIPDPLKKNLADTVVTNTEKQKEVSQPQYYYEPTMTGEKVANENSAHRSDFYPSIAGITTFFSNFFGAISGAMFHSRPKSPVTQYFDCYESDSHMSQQMSLDDWQTANIDDQNKTEAPVQFSMVSHGNMNNCKAAVAQCESKINAVRSLLKNKPTNPPKSKLRRPRRAFVDPASVEDSYEEDFVPDDFISLPNEHYVNHIVIGNNQDHIFTEIDSPKMKTEIGSVPATNDIVKVISDNKSEFADTSVILNDPKAKQENLNSTTTNSIEKSTGQQNCATTQNPIPTDKQNLNLTEIKKEVISSCEDKMARLKSLLQEKCKKQKVAPADPIPVPTNDRPKPKPIPIDKKHDKRFKNPCRLVDKRKKAKLKNNIQDDMNFANELDSEEIESSLDNSPAILSNHVLQRISETLPESFESDKEYFDELKGRFHSASTTDSEDSFQIVFSDSPKLSRMRRPSDCDSEDSFVVFEDSPDSCYTSNDVFGDHQTTDESDSECSDDDSDISDSGCGTDVCKISHSFSRTVSDLTDDTLYEEVKATELSENNDEVDCAVVEKPVDDAFVKPGLLIDEVKKRQRKDQPSKKVSFSEAPPKVHVMRVWAFAARQARAGHWERHALDRERFRRRIADVDMAVSWVLKPQHRRRVMFQRFMPWWNAQKRKEAAEKKQKAEEEKLRLEKETEEEKLRLEKEAEDKAKEEVLAVDTNHILEEKVPKPILEVEREKKEIENDIIKEDVIEKLENLKLFMVKEKVLTN